PDERCGGLRARSRSQMSTYPIVSTLIPVHNQETFVGRCLRSILNQTLSRDDYEVIVVNDGSTDNTGIALKAFGDEITVINNSQRLGLPASLNRGVRVAKGRFIVRLDSDDYVHKEYLNVLSMFLTQNSWMDAVACDYVLVDDHEEIISRKNCEEDP